MGILEKMSLSGKKGFVTGAARGIGKCTATAFAEAGADLAIVDMDIETAEKTAKEIAEATGRTIIAIKCDVTDEAQVQAMVDEVVDRLGGLDFCHANAGICINAPADEMTYAQWKKNLAVNLDSVFLTDTIAGKYMLAVDDNGEHFDLSPDPMLPQLLEQVKSIEFGKPESLTDQLKPLLANADLFGINLYDAGIGTKIEQMVREMLAGPGAVRRTLHRCLFTAGSK